MNAKTKLSEALKLGPEVLEYIISLNPHDFARLRNPLMQKVMPARITLGRIAKMVNISERELLTKIRELSETDVEIEIGVDQSLPMSPVKPPQWFERVNEKTIVWVDLLAQDEKLLDPMPPINIQVNGLIPGAVLGIKHKWQPQPLFDIWQGRGLKFWSRKMSEDEWHIFVHKPLA